MATLSNTGMANQMAFGQHGSAFMDGTAAYTAPSGKVVVAITFLEDTVFSALTPEATGDCFGLAASSGQGTGNEVVAGTTVFPKGLTVYGRWTTLTTDAASSNGGVILYLGPAKSPIQSA
jgi:hypothetical protein